MQSIKSGDVIEFVYKNWKGKTSKRKAIVEDFIFGHNEWHKEPQMMIKGFDVEKESVRTFATKDISKLMVINTFYNQ